MLLLVFFVACQKATLIPSYEDYSIRTTEEVSSDSTDVNVDFKAEGWDEAINADFTFGGVQQKGGNE